MKIKTTKKEIKDTNKKIIKVGYCAMQTLLLGQDAFAYSDGVYGWSCDYYNINGVIISTGYSPIGSSVDYDILREYEEKAELVNSEFGNFQKRIEKINNLLLEFIEKIK